MGQKGWEHDIWIFLHASTSNVMIQARADDMAGSRGRPWGCKNEAKSVKKAWCYIGIKLGFGRG